MAPIATPEAAPGGPDTKHRWQLLRGDPTQGSGVGVLDVREGH
jgi:hypothetical protein